MTMTAHRRTDTAIAHVQTDTGRKTIILYTLVKSEHMVLSIKPSGPGLLPLDLCGVQLWRSWPVVDSLHSTLHLRSSVVTVGGSRHAFASFIHSAGFWSGVHCFARALRAHSRETTVVGDPVSKSACTVIPSKTASVLIVRPRCVWLCPCRGVEVAMAAWVSSVAVSFSFSSCTCWTNLLYWASHFSRLVARAHSCSNSALIFIWSTVARS